MRTGKKIAAALMGFIAIALVGVGWLFFKGNRAQPITVDLPAEAVRSLMKLAGVHQTATKGGAVQWELNAVSAELEAESGRMVLSAPKVQFFLEDGSQVHLSAKKGILLTRSNDIQVKGHVKVRNDRYTLLTEELFYQHNTRVLKSAVPVQIIGSEINLSAAGMTYDLEKNKALFSGRVMGSVHEDFSI